MVLRREPAVELLVEIIAQPASLWAAQHLRVGTMLSALSHFIHRLLMWPPPRIWEFKLFTGAFLDKLADWFYLCGSEGTHGTVWDHCLGSWSAPAFVGHGFIMPVQASAWWETASIQQQCRMALTWKTLPCTLVPLDISKCAFPEKEFHGRILGKAVLFASGQFLLWCIHTCLLTLCKETWMRRNLGLCVVKICRKKIKV